MAVLLLTLALLLASCEKKSPQTVPDEVRTNVAVERGQQGSAVVATKPVAFRARYDVEILPDYPPEAVEARVSPVEVRVDFRVGKDGLAHGVRAATTNEVPLAEAFEEACVEILERWRFSPAWRLRRDDEPGDDPIVLIESRASLVFRFDLEVSRAGGEIEVDFDAGS